MRRPLLNEKISIQDFQNYYWLKEELVAFCKLKGIHSAGGKIEVAERIAHFIKTGEITLARQSKLPKKTSSFDWNKATLTLDTPITDSYKNSENVRQFLVREIGSHFRFSVDFMQWAQQNIGKTLIDAIVEWKRIYELKKDKKNKTEIAPQFEYNRYIRDFLEDNPNKGTQEAIKYWKLKKALPGTNAYDRTDLELV